MMHPEHEGGTMRDRHMKLSKDVQALLPLEYAERLSDMHCNPESLGGSKFLSREDGGVNDALEVIEQLGPEKFAQMVADRQDDREALMAAGAPESAFLPATKGAEHPEGLPEALYIKVDGVKGRLGIKTLEHFDPSTKVLVEREKGASEEGADGYVPPSFTVVEGTAEDMPETDFATIIVGRAGGGDDAVWTMHPGEPVKPPLRNDLEWTKGLKSPDELGPDAKRQGIVVTVQDLLESGLTPKDFVKLAPGNLEEATAGYDMQEKP